MRSLSGSCEPHTKSRYTANGILKDAGLPKAF